jgi:hypothetical protein
VGDSCEHGNESLGSIKYWEFLGWLSNCLSSQGGLSSMELGSWLVMFTSYVTTSNWQSSEECFDVSVPVGHFPAVQYTRSIMKIESSNFVMMM